MLVWHFVFSASSSAFPFLVPDLPYDLRTSFCHFCQWKITEQDKENTDQLQTCLPVKWNWEQNNRHTDKQKGREQKKKKNWNEIYVHIHMQAIWLRFYIVSFSDSMRPFALILNQVCLQQNFELKPTKLLNAF